MNLVSFIIPAYNSESTISLLCKKIVGEMKKIGKEYEIIIVDDYSKDKTYEVIKKICLENKKIKGISLKKNYGQQNALYCGIIFSKGNYIFTLDDDMQNPPELIEKMIKKVDKGYDLVYAIPVKNNNKNYVRKFGTFHREKFFLKNFPQLKELKVSSFRVFKGNIREKIRNERTKYIYISCLLLREVKRVSNISYEYRKRKIGKSNYSFLKLFIMFFNLNVYYSKKKYLKFFRKKGEPFEISESINLNL